MNSKPKSIDMGSLIQKVTKRARELLKKKSKPQTKGKSANGTSRYSKSKRQKLLIGGVSVNIDDKKKEDILNIIGIKTKEAGKEKAQAHLVELLKLKTIQKIESALLEYSEKAYNKPDRISLDYTAEEIEIVKSMENILDEVGLNLKLSTTIEIDNFKKNQKNLQKFYKILDPSLEEKNTINNSEKEIYEYELFTQSLKKYKECNIEKEITALNIFKLFYELTIMKEDQKDEMGGGGYRDEFKYTIENGVSIGGPIEKVRMGEKIIDRITAYKKLLKENKETINNIRTEFQGAGLVEKNKKGAKNEITAEIAYATDPAALNLGSPSSISETILGATENEALEASTKRNATTDSIMKELEKQTLKVKLTEQFENIKKLFTNPDLKFDKAFVLKFGEKYFLKFETTTNGQAFIVSRNRKPDEIQILAKITESIDNINTILIDITKEFNNLIERDNTGLNIDKFIIDNTKNLENLINIIKTNYDILKKTKEWVKNNNLQQGGGNPVKYKSTGQVVHIMFQNKKYKRVIYVKEKRNTKYCKMNNEYILLSKLKVVE